MATFQAGDFPIDPNTVDGTELAVRLNRMKVVLDGAVVADASGNVEIGTGNVGIGTATSSIKFQVEGGSGSNVVAIKSTAETGSALLYTVNSNVSVPQWYVGHNGVDVDTGNLRAGALKFVTNRSERMWIDSAGNVGIGGAPSAWGTDYKVIESTENSAFAISSATVNPVKLVGNAYATNTDFIYKTTGAAAAYECGNLGTHRWSIAPSGTAGNAVSFTQAMTLDTSGNLLVGNTATTGSTANNAIVLGGILKTISGSVSTATGTATTLYTAPSLANGTYILSVGINSAAEPATYSAVSLISVDSTVIVATALKTATSMTISVSGQNVQATQASGGAATIVWTATRVH